MNTQHERAEPLSPNSRSVIEPLADHWQHERFWLELVADGNTGAWLLCLRDRSERRARRQLNLDQVLTLLTSRSHNRSGSPDSSDV